MIKDRKILKLEYKKVSKRVQGPGKLHAAEPITQQTLC